MRDRIMLHIIIFGLLIWVISVIIIIGAGKFEKYRKKSKSTIQNIERIVDVDN